MITETTGLLAKMAQICENVPEELTERPQWVCWRYEERDEKLTKVPHTITGGAASTTDLMTWTPFEAALAAYERGRWDGIGFMFSSADPYVGIDLDHCRDPESGDIEPWAQEIIERFEGDAYIEASPSGCGIHIIVRGAVRGGGMRKGNLEMYSRGRFFTMTGHVL
jgi:putative DNA primase/helicase